MVDIRIDTRQLAGTMFQIVGSDRDRHWLARAETPVGADGPTISLEPGKRYGFQEFGTPASFRFTVTPDGPIAYEAFLDGRATALSHDV